MFKILNLDNWSEYYGFPEGSGCSRKIWLINNSTGQIGLFKYPKENYDGSLTTEYLSEHLAYQIGKIIGIETATIDIAYYNCDLGCISYDIIDDHQNNILIEGVSFLLSKYPEYDRDNFRDNKNGQYYNIKQIIDSAPIKDKMPIYKMLLFDFLIGNSDRHHNNYAFIKNEITGKYKFCSLYDNGSSLCCRITENKITDYLGNDKNKIKSLTNTKSKSCIGIDGYQKRGTCIHSDMMQYVLLHNDSLRLFATDVIRTFNNTCIDNLLSQYPSDIMSFDRRLLINTFLQRKIMILSDILEGSYE